MYPAAASKPECQNSCGHSPAISRTIVEQRNEKTVNPVDPEQYIQRKIPQPRETEQSRSSQQAKKKGIC
jgi:hypothetical protein